MAKVVSTTREVLGGGAEKAFIRTKTGNNPCSGYRIMLSFSIRPISWLHMGGENVHQLKVLVRSLYVTRKDALKHSELVSATYEHIGDSPFVGNYQNIFLAEPKRVKLVDGEFINDPGNTAASAKARLGMSDLWLVDTGCGHDLVSAHNAKLSKGKKFTLDNQVTFQTPMAMPLALTHLKSSLKN